MIAHSKPTVGEAEGAAVARVVASGNLAQGTEVASKKRVLPFSAVVTP